MCRTEKPVAVTFEKAVADGSKCYVCGDAVYLDAWTMTVKPRGREGHVVAYLCASCKHGMEPMK